MVPRSHRKPTHLGVAHILFVSAASGWGLFASSLRRFGHVSKCFKEGGDRNDSCSSLCWKSSANPEDNCRLCVEQRSFGRDWRGVGTFWQLSAEGLGVPAVKKATEVRHTLGHNYIAYGDIERQFLRTAWLGHNLIFVFEPGDILLTFTRFCHIDFAFNHGNCYVAHFLSSSGI